MVGRLYLELSCSLIVKNDEKLKKIKVLAA